MVHMERVRKQLQQSQIVEIIYLLRNIITII